MSRLKIPLNSGISFIDNIEVKWSSYEKPLNDRISP